MSYAICRMEKMKGHALKGIQFHNQRERESRTNPHIDPMKSHENYDLVNSKKIDYNKRIKEIIERQKVGTRKTRKDAVLVNEFMITSDKDFFDRLEPKEQKRYFEEAHQWFAERYGEQNMAYATVHMDEKTPHMHLGVVPMRDGRLQGKNVFNRQELRSLQEDFPKHMRDLGFDLQRGEKGSDREHLTTQDLKAKTLKEKVATLEKEIGDKEHSLAEKREHLTDLKQSLDHVKKVDQVAFKEGGLFGHKTAKLELSEFEGIKTQAKLSESLRGENRALRRDLEETKEENTRLKDDNQHLGQENKALAHENRFLKKTLSQLKEVYKDRVKDFSRTVGICKAFVLSKLEGRLPEKCFADEQEKEGARDFLQAKKEKQQEKAIHRDRDQGMER
ncbi:plasmid recombination enzyme [Scopulibacillus darangshiensis]|uniref:Plasmid recombination enzyme n=1 Tax=Scopulibacillus darangshiensis TaxID=442528 RepID=A0A4R2NAD6_9BACL|nr:plasmid recombination enzyme [Scopulibacillus darangshiensis]